MHPMAMSSNSKQYSEIPRSKRLLYVHPIVLVSSKSKKHAEVPSSRRLLYLYAMMTSRPRTSAPCSSRLLASWW